MFGSSSNLLLILFIALLLKIILNIYTLEKFENLNNKDNAIIVNLFIDSTKLNETDLLNEWNKCIDLSKKQNNINIQTNLYKLPDNQDQFNLYQIESPDIRIINTDGNTYSYPPIKMISEDIYNQNISYTFSSDALIHDILLAYHRNNNTNLELSN